MVVNDYAGNLTPRGVLRFIASGLAPTGGARHLHTQPPTKELEISTQRVIVVRAAAPKNLHHTGKISRV
jgi:hypothetical protein